MDTGLAKRVFRPGVGQGSLLPWKHGCRPCNKALERVLEWVLTPLDWAFHVLACPVATLPVSYTSVSYVNTALPSISSVSNISSGVIAQYAGGVEAEINAMISKRYALPLTSECPILTAIATRETIYRIAVQRALVQFPPAQQGQHPMLTQHKDDQKLLERIMNGEIQLIADTGAVIAADITQLEIYSTTKTYLPTFHEGPWGDMVQDENKINDLLTDRDL